MQRFNLRLTTEELKTLQSLVEDRKIDADRELPKPAWAEPARSESEVLRDILTKIIVTQVEAETPFVYHKVDSETDLAF